MLKHLSRLALIATVVLSSALHATGDSFSYEFEKVLEETTYIAWPLDHGTTVVILAEQDGSDGDDLIVKTIKKLVTEIDSEKAASMYLACVKNTFDKAIATINFESLASSKNEDEAKQALGNLFQNLFNAMTSKDTVLEQAIYFATFSDEIVKDITNTMSALTQEHVIKMSQFQCKNEAQDMAKEIKKIFDEFLTNTLNATATVFENHGYKIDRKSLVL